MRSTRRYLVFVLVVSLFELGLALQPQLISEMPVEGKIIGGDVSDGNLVFSSPEKLWISTRGEKESFQMNLKQNQGVVASEDGSFFGITTYSKDVPAGFLAAERFELYSADGKKLWEIENPEVSEFYVANGAKLIVGISGAEGGSESGLAFYNQTGELILSTRVASPQEFSFSADGERFFVNSAKEGLLSYGDSGDVSARFGKCQNFAVSPDGEHLATVSDGQLRFFHQGKPAGDSLEIKPLVRRMSFSPENDYLVAIDRKNLYLFEVAGGKLLWQHTLDQPELSFISLDVSPGAEMIIAGVDFDKGRQVDPKDRHTRGFTYIFDKEGKITWQREFSYKLWGALFPLVKFSSDGMRFSVMTREKVYVFSANQPGK